MRSERVNGKRVYYFDCKHCGNINNYESAILLSMESVSCSHCREVLGSGVNLHCMVSFKLDGGKGGLLDGNNILWKWHEGQWTGKPGIQTKDLRTKWLEEIDPEEIDTRYFNKDGTRK